jgi:hypothetical protein
VKNPLISIDNEIGSVFVAFSSNKCLYFFCAMNIKFRKKNNIFVNSFVAKYAMVKVAKI